MSKTRSAAEEVQDIVRRGRPPGTSARALELVALKLFAEQGFDETTVDDIAAGAGVSRRTFFRYFDTKANVLWSEFDSEVNAIASLLADVGAQVPIMQAVSAAVIEVNHYRPEDVSELRSRMNLIATVPALAASAAVHYDAWVGAIAAFVGKRIGQPATSLYPLAVGRATLSACRAAYEQWAIQADADLTYYLSAALSALSSGFADEQLRATSRLQ